MKKGKRLCALLLLVLFVVSSTACSKEDVASNSRSSSEITSDNNDSSEDIIESGDSSNINSEFVNVSDTKSHATGNNGNQSSKPSYTWSGENDDGVMITDHLTQPFGFIFDPCGAFYFEGRYHVFSYHNIMYLLNYSSLDHYVSEDLVHWTQWPIAPFADSDHDVFCIYLLNHFIDDDGNLRTLYTGQGFNGKCGILAKSDDGMLSYTDKKAVITKYHHDGHVFKHGDKWYTITSKLCRGSRAGDKGDPVMLWSSVDLETWVEEGEIFTQRKGTHNPEGFMEFPYLISFKEKDVLILGGHPVYYWVGKFDWNTKKFIPEQEKGTLLDLSNPFHCYNPLCVDNKSPDGSPRRLLMALYTDVSVRAANESIWCCTHAQPRVLSLDGSHLRQDPLPELEQRRSSPWSLNQARLSPGSSIIMDVHSNCVEIFARFDPVGQGKFGIKIFLPCEQNESVCVWFDADSRDFGIDGSVAHTGKGPSYILAKQSIEIRIFIDRQLIEVFVNGQSCTTSICSDVSNVKPDIVLYSDEADCCCDELHIWRMDEKK